MTEAAKVRLVRCPKCENLLPELPDFSLYQCGGCGAVLKGKTKGILVDGLLEPSSDLKGARVSDESNIISASVVKMETTDENPRMERIHNERAASDRSSTSRAEHKDLLNGSDLNRRGKQRIGRLEHFDDDDEYMPYPTRAPVRYRNQGNNSDLNINRPDYTNFKETKPPMESLRPRPVMDQWGPKSNEPAVSYGPSRGRYEYDNFPYHGEGSSSYEMNPYYEHGGRTRYQSHNLAIENLENGRAELLRKLDELKDQLTKSCELAEKPKERVDTDPYCRQRPVYVPEGLTRSNGQPFLHDELEAQYLSQGPGFIPYRDRYPQRGYPHEFNRPDMLRVSHQQPRSHHMHGPYHEHYPGYYDDVNHDLMMLHRHENLFHQPACSCLHCYNKNLDYLPGKVDHLNLHDRRARNEPPHPGFHHSLNHTLHGPQSYSVHPEHSRRTPIQNPSDQDTEHDGFSFHRPRKIAISHKNGKLWHPIAGGAPFVTCSNCFELLKLPRKRIFLAKKKLEMKCGACSSTILFELGNNGCVVPASVRLDEVLTEIDDGSSGTGDENARYWHGGSISADMNALSNDYEESQPKLTSMDKNLNSGEPDKQMDPLSWASSLAENEQSPIKVSSEQHGSPSPGLDLPSQKFHDNCADNILVNRSENGSKSKRSEQERFSDTGTSRQGSLKDAVVATEMDASLSGFSNSCQDSVEIIREDHSRGGNKGGDSFFAGLIKKSFKKPNNNVESGGSHVYVNGHLILDRVVKKAEKLAGPIQPGDYWYDVEAGFWGVMGYPCLGIIMPNIEEFNYRRMPEKCGAGNTGVYVNGRELNEKDLELLASRGLPITRHRSYTIEMSGKVVDDQTGEELLDGLGKLAPTVEKAKHGFGMRVPKYITQAQS